ncbi:MAG: MFS transporter [Defluviitaleaceae bacterium]|nr:MFS transporter [Defluviitaleaceae bacterium]
MIKLFKENPNFRKFLMFSTFLGIGDGMFSMFMMWVVHYTYQNPVYTGIAGFMLAAPMVLGFIAGPWVDRWNKAVVLRFTTFLKMGVAAAILASHLIYYPGVWLFFAGIFLFRVGTVFSSTAYTSLLPRIVDGDDIVKANVATNITGITGGLIIGGTMIVLLRNAINGDGGFGPLYIILAGTLAVSMFFALLLRSPEGRKAGKSTTKAYFAELKQGFAFARKGVMLPLIAATISMSFFNDVAYVNFPAFAELHMGDASGYIILSMLALTGSLVGSIIVGMVDKKFALWKILVGGFLLAGAVRIGFVQTIQHHVVAGILVYVMYIGLGSMISIFFHVLVQKLPPKGIISRVDTSIKSLSAVAVALGALAGGFLGRWLGDVNLIFMLQGASYVLIGICLISSKRIRTLPKIGEIGNSE